MGAAGLLGYKVWKDRQEAAAPEEPGVEPKTVIDPSKFKPLGGDPLSRQPPGLGNLPAPLPAPVRVTPAAVPQAPYYGDLTTQLRYKQINSFRNPVYLDVGDPFFIMASALNELSPTGAADGMPASFDTFMQTHATTAPYSLDAGGPTYGPLLIATVPGTYSLRLTPEISCIIIISAGLRNPFGPVTSV